MILIASCSKILNITHTKSQNLNDSHCILQLYLPNPLKPGVMLSWQWRCSWIKAHHQIGAKPLSKSIMIKASNTHAHYQAKVSWIKKFLCWIAMDGHTLKEHSWHLQLLANRLFDQWLIQPNSKVNTKTFCYWPSVRDSINHHAAFSGNHGFP